MAPIKRARTEEDDEIVEIVEAASSALRRVQAKRPRTSPQNEDAQVSADSENEARRPVSGVEIPASQFEQYKQMRDEGASDSNDDEADIHKEAQRIKRRNAQVIENAPNENGIIESVTCINFMCHSRLEVKFGPLINFIIGHNGSGKSAVLTALTLCLGTKASSTNRGQNLKSFIKEGQDSALVMVRIKNRGHSAYSHDLYGDSIIVERHFNKAGTSGFRIKSANGRVISLKRADLEDICDFYALQLDNPINVLTQDMARQFLNSSSPVEKYRFFIKGVQLEQLDQDYALLSEYVENIEWTLQNREGDIKALQERKTAAEHRLRLSERHDELRDKLRNYRRQMAWAQVEGEEQGIVQREQQVEKDSAKISSCEQTAAKADDAYEQANQRHEAAIEALRITEQSLEPFTEQQTAAKERWDTHKTELQDTITQQRAIREHCEQAKYTIGKLNSDISEERGRLEAADGGNQAAKLQEIDDAQAAVREAERRKKEHDEQLSSLLRSQRTVGEREDETHKKLDAKRDELRLAERQLESLRNDRNQQRNAYDENLPTLLKAIQNESGFREKPVGPMGHHIRLLKPEWSSIIESTFGMGLNSFIVTSKQDSDLLSQLIRRTRCLTCQIYIGRANRIDVSRNEPDERYDTILRVLEIDNDLVRNQIIINNAVENTVLIPKRQDGYDFMFEGPRARNVKVCLTMHDHKRGVGHRMRHGRGGISIEPVRAWTSPPRMKTEAEAQIRLQAEAITSLKGDVKDHEIEYRSLQEQSKRANQAVQRHKMRSKDLQLNAQRADDEVARLKDELEASMPLDGRLDALKEELESAQIEEDQYQGQLRAAGEQREQQSLRGRELKNELDSILGQIEEVQNRMQKATLKRDKLAEARQTALYSKNRAHEAIKDACEDKAATEADLARFRVHVEDFIRQASQISERVPVDRGETVRSLEIKLKRFTNDLARSDNELNGDHASIARAAVEAKTAYEQGAKGFDDLRELVKQLKMALNERCNRWLRFRNSITFRTRSSFEYLLSERAFRGKLSVHHAKRTLDVRIEPDIRRRGTAAAQGRATATLSGGEKSFSTICLLLALWEAMGSPIRCLDEFDVFMDSVNREISLQMLISAARRAVGRQFILITPQSMANVNAGRDVKIIKLLDPERGQTVLDV